MSTQPVAESEAGPAFAPTAPPADACDETLPSAMRFTTSASWDMPGQASTAAPSAADETDVAGGASYVVPVKDALRFSTSAGWDMRFTVSQPPEGFGADAVPLPTLTEADPATEEAGSTAEAACPPAESATPAAWDTFEGKILKRAQWMLQWREREAQVLRATGGGSASLLVWRSDERAGSLELDCNATVAVQGNELTVRNAQREIVFKASSEGPSISEWHARIVAAIPKPPSAPPEPSEPASAAAAPAAAPTPAAQPAEIPEPKVSPAVAAAVAFAAAASARV